MIQLDSEETEILETYEQGKLNRVKNASQEIERHKAVADATFTQDVSVNVPLSSRDFRILQVRALQEGIPYLTLASSILHKFVDGQLVDKSANK